jgi:outer membrane protein
MQNNQMKYIFSTVLLLLINLGVYAQQAPTGQTHRFTLQECIDYAYEHQDSLKNAKLDIESADYKVKEIFGMGLPQVSGSANLQDFLKLPTSLLPGEFFGQPAGTFIPVKFGVKYQSSLGLNLDQLIFDGTYLVGLKASKTYKELSIRNYDRTKITVNVAVTKAFYMVLVSGEQLRLLDANLNQLKQQISETSELFKQGFAEEIDIDRLTVQQNNLTNTRENVVRSLALLYEVLKFQMGMPLSESLSLNGKIEDVKLDNETSVLKADTTAYENRIEYRLLQTQKALSELDLKRYKSQYLPSVSAFGSHSLNYQNNSLGDLYSQNFPNTLIGLRVNIPIFSGFQRLNRVKQAQISVIKNDNILNSVKNAIKLDVENSRTKYLNSLVSLNSQKGNMDLAAKILKVSKIKYENGIGSNLEVTQAQTSLEQAQTGYIQSLYDALIGKVDLEKASGKITY